MNQIVLERVDPADLGSCREFADFVGAHYRGAVPLTPGAVASGSIRYFWAKSDGVRVGATGYVVRTEALAETVKTVVDPVHRGRGLGAAISQAIEDEVRRAGFRKVMTTIYIDNYAMILIKLKQGYRFEGFHPDHERPGWHEYSFGKVLG
jgi:GNAT superfamily N-acetyltransferase